MGMNAIKITAVLSAAALSLCLMTECKVQAKNIVDNGDFKYVISDDGKSAEIISYVGQSLYVSVPDEVNNCAVVSIGAAAFKDNQKLKELEISGSIKSIDTAAFSGCSSLSKVHISGSVKNVGESAFSNCSSLKELSLDDGILSIGKFAFADCTSLEKAVIPNSVDQIGDYAFVNCTKLSSPQIPKSLRYFGGYALENTKWMSNQKGDFVTIGDGILIKYIGESEIKSIPDSIKTVGSYAFAGNKNLKNVMIPSSVNVVQNSAFEGCEKLENIYMPASVEKLGQRAFYGCKSLKKIDLTERMSVIENYCFSKSGLEEIRIPKNVTSINKAAFESCKSLRNVMIGDGVKKICEASFKDCTSLKRIVFPKNVTVIEKDAFSGCKNLIRAEFNGDVVISDNAFGDCVNMGEAVFYSNPKDLLDNAFNQVPKLVIYSENNLYLDEYAQRNSKKSDSLKNLPLYNEYISPSNNKDEEQTFSAGYTFITIIIIMIDIAVIGLFAFYILVIDVRKTRKAASTAYGNSRHRNSYRQPERKQSQRTKVYSGERKTSPVKTETSRAVSEIKNTRTEIRQPIPKKRQIKPEVFYDEPIRRPVQKPQEKPSVSVSANEENSEQSVTFAKSSKKQRKPIRKQRPDEEVTYVQAPRRKTRPVQGKRLYESEVTYVSPKKKTNVREKIYHEKEEDHISDTEYDMKKFRSGDTMIFKKTKK